MVRVVFDTSSIVGAVLLTRSIPAQAMRHALAMARICSSGEAMDELQAVLRRPKFDRYLPLAARREFYDIYVRAAHVYDIPVALFDSLSPRSRDPADDKFLALAAACRADLIVSSDDDLLSLHPWHGVRILRPAEFMEQYS